MIEKLTEHLRVIVSRAEEIERLFDDNSVLSPGGYDQVDRIRTEALELSARYRVYAQVTDRRI